MTNPSPVSEIRDDTGRLISTLHPAHGLDELQIQQQVRAARSRTEFILAERRELAKRLLAHIPSSGDDRFNCLCGEVCASASDWAAHTSEQALMPHIPAQG